VTEVTRTGVHVREEFRERFVVKVQIPLAGTINEMEQILIYNKDKSIYHQEKDPASIQAMKNAMRDAPKAYFYARLNDDAKLVIEDLAPWQLW